MKRARIRAGKTVRIVSGGMNFGKEGILIQHDESDTSMPFHVRLSRENYVWCTSIQIIGDAEGNYYDFDSFLEGQKVIIVEAAHSLDDGKIGIIDKIDLTTKSQLRFKVAIEPEGNYTWAYLVRPANENMSDDFTDLNDSETESDLSNLAKQPKALI